MQSYRNIAAKARVSYENQPLLLQNSKHVSKGVRIPDLLHRILLNLTSKHRSEKHGQTGTRCNLHTEKNFEKRLRTVSQRSLVTSATNCLVMRSPFDFPNPNGILREFFAANQFIMNRYRQSIILNGKLDQRVPYWFVNTNNIILRPQNRLQKIIPSTEASSLEHFKYTELKCR